MWVEVGSTQIDGGMTARLRYCKHVRIWRQGGQQQKRELRLAFRAQLTYIQYIAINMYRFLMSKKVFIWRIKASCL